MQSSLMLQMHSQLNNICTRIPFPNWKLMLLISVPIAFWLKDPNLSSICVIYCLSIFFCKIVEHHRKFFAKRTWIGGLYFGVIGFLQATPSFAQAQGGTSACPSSGILAGIATAINTVFGGIGNGILADYACRLLGSFNIFWVFAGLAVGIGVFLAISVQNQPINAAANPLIGILAGALVTAVVAAIFVGVNGTTPTTPAPTI
jgi:hypothetical protein